ncbi:uncharacterized protein LOC132045491 [Lycium ferocissimum]|uniref:uncharacterized protein LOC132045491 n=1 Tax=Lycium ferocissimum TaxID=112874 RepID=UPI002814CA3D|nr:uncharacterized protein LOC132045491 [Lycium ferocissimum]
MKSLKIVLSEWSRNTFGDLFKLLNITEDRVGIKEQLFEVEPSEAYRMVLQRAYTKFKKYLHVEEFWRQNAGKTWQSQGDRNTRYFHSRAKRRRKRLQLTRIQNAEGEWLQNINHIASEAIDFYQSIFYQKCWDIVGADMRPIRLSNFINKVISRVIHDKLEFILPSLISSNPSSFIKGRNIIENVLLTQELVADTRKRGKPGNVIIKLDITKAYDRVSLTYLAQVIKKMGFVEVHVDMVWRLIANNWYSILINGQSHGIFHSTRGIKKGDPLSPALFILAVEVLSTTLNSLFDNGVLHEYESVSGQKINAYNISFYMHTKVANELSQEVQYNIITFKKFQLMEED